MNKKIIFPVVFVGILIVITAGLVFATRSKEPVKNLDEFAKCLAEKGVTMYGAKWCSHCQNQKKSFGESWKYVPYVECPEQIKLCTTKGVQGFPTWELQDGKKLVGEQDLQTLSMETGCRLP